MNANIEQTIAHAANSTYPKVALQWLNKALCFYENLCLIDSESTRNRHLRVAAKRWWQFYSTKIIFLISLCKILLHFINSLHMGWFSKTYKHKCPDGTIRIIHKNMDDAFPLAVKDSKTSVNGNLTPNNIGLRKLKADYETKIKGLLFNINEQNQSLMISFRFAYAAFQADPCGNNAFITRQSEQFSLGQQRLMELKTQITGLITLAESYPNNPEKVLPMYNEIVGKIGGHASIAATVNAIEDNRNTAEKWIKGGKDE